MTTPDPAQQRRSFLLVVCCTLIGAAAQVLIKKGAGALGANPTMLQTALKKGIFRFETVQKDAAGGGSVRSVVHQGKTTVVVTIHAAGNGSQVEIKTLDRDTRN